MSRGLICVFAIGGLLLIVLAEGQPLAAGTGGPVIDKAALAQVRKLQEKRRATLRDLLGVRGKLYRTNHATTGDIVVASKRLLAVELDLAATAAERIAAHQRHLEIAQMMVEIAKVKRDNIRAHEGDVLDAQDAVLEAKVGLLKAGGKLKKAEK